MSYSVSQVQTAQIAAFEAMDVVWFFHLNTYPDEDLSNVKRIHQYNTDWEAIAALALEAGVSGASVHFIDQAGYRWMDSGVNIPPHTMDAQTFPRFSHDYKITNAQQILDGLTVNHIYRFHKAFKSRGMKVGLYFNTGQALNLFDANDYTTNNSSKAVWNEWMVRELKYMTYMYEWDWLYWDLPIPASFTSTQLDNIYQAARHHTGSLLMQNLSDGMGNSRFPFDIKSAEFTHLPSEGESFWSPETVVDSVTYYMPATLSYTGLYSRTDGGVESPMWQWRKYSGTAGLTENLIRDQSDFNTWYSYARTRNVPFFLNIPLLDGAFDATYLNRAQNLSA